MLLRQMFFQTVGLFQSVEAYWADKWFFVPRHFLDFGGISYGTLGFLLIDTSSNIPHIYEAQMNLNMFSQILSGNDHNQSTLWTCELGACESLVHEHF